MRRLRGLALVLAAVALVLGALEVGARHFYAPAKPPPTLTYVPADPNLRELTTFSDLDLHNQRGLYKGVLYETNRLRLRSPERPLEKPPGVSRIAVLGDSFVMGDGVLAEHSYVWRLEDEMPRVRAGAYETINVGLSGLDAAHAIQRYARLGLVYQPDVAVYGFTINDIEGPRYVKRMTEARDPYGVESSRSMLWRLVGPGYVAFREEFWPPAGSYVEELRYNFFENEAAWADFTAALSSLAAMNEERGICTVLFLHTQLVTLNALHPFRSVYEKVAAAGRERGFLVVQSLPVFLGRRDKGLWVNLYDSHPNVEGHRLLAAALADGLGELPESCWGTLDGTRASR